MSLEMYGRGLEYKIILLRCSKIEKKKNSVTDRMSQHCIVPKSQFTPAVCLILQTNDMV